VRRLSLDHKKLGYPHYSRLWANCLPFWERFPNKFLSKRRQKADGFTIVLLGTMWGGNWFHYLPSGEIRIAYCVGRKEAAFLRNTQYVLRDLASEDERQIVNQFLGWLNHARYSIVANSSVPCSTD